MLHPGPETLGELGKHPHARSDVLTGHTVSPKNSRVCCLDSDPDVPRVKDLIVESHYPTGKDTANPYVPPRLVTSEGVGPCKLIGTNAYGHSIANG